MPVHDWTRVNAGIFHDFHLSWVHAISKVLNGGLLPSGYYALIEQGAQDIRPDFLVAPESEPDDEGDVGPTGISLAKIPPQVRLSGVLEEDAYAYKRRSLAVRRVRGDHLVALVEVVSPGNKSGPIHLRSFVERVASALEGGYHLMLLDLHPPGPCDPQGIHPLVWGEFEDKEFSLPPDKPLTLASYTAGDVKRYFVETVAVGDALPDMPLFLDPDYYVRVPLEASYRAAWDAVPRRWRRELES